MHRPSLIFAALLLSGVVMAPAQRSVEFPPAESKPPPPQKAPPKTQTSGEETDITPMSGASIRKTQVRTPPPPTNLTIIYKVQYGEDLKYVYPDGTEQIFPQWESFKNDASNLVKFTNLRLKDGNNYQYATAPLATKFDPLDIPILYMTGDYDFKLTDDEVENIRKYVMGGGTLIFNAARGRTEFVGGVIREMKRVFPDLSFMRLPLDHPIFNSHSRIAQTNTMVSGTQATKPPEVYSIDIGTRAAVILVPLGLGTAWSSEQYNPSGRHIVGEGAIRLGVNLVAYVLGTTEYGKFLAQTFPTYHGTTRPGDVFRFAQVRYKGSWFLNPGLQNSLLAGLHKNTGIEVDYAPLAVELNSPEVRNYPLLFMTGHYDFELSPAERQGLVQYLDRGGMLVASAAAGLSPFDTAFRREMKKAFPESELVPLPPSHSIFMSGWNPVKNIEYTSTALRDEPDLKTPEFYGLFIHDRLAVLYTPYDFASGLNRESNSYAKGVESRDALRLALNLITYSLSH